MEKSGTYKNRINIYHLIEGARQARGLTVIIDVFRAFSLECCLYDMGAALIRPAGTLEEAFSWREKDPDCVLVGERKGKKCEGFDFGNSPSSIRPEDVRGKRIIHTTSAGTQGIVNAVNAEQIITGSLLNARAVAEYIIRRQPEEVSLVCMGNGGVAPAREDELCAEYIAAILKGEEIPDFSERVKNLRYDGGEHFFNPHNQEVFPEEDFRICTEYDRFDFILKVEKDDEGFIVRPQRV